MPLTDVALRAMKPQGTTKLHADGGGLYVRVHPSGTKTFLVRDRAGGKDIWTTLGSYPALSLKAAREEAARKRSQTSDTITIGDAFDEWYERVIERRYRSPVQVSQRMLPNFVNKAPKRPLYLVTKAEMSRLLSDKAATAPVHANRLLGDMKNFFSYCVERGWLEHSPVASITRKSVGGKEKSRRRVLSEDDFRKLWGELLSDRFAGKTRLALAITALTGQRSGDVRGVCRSEVVGDVWRISAGRMKKSEEDHIVLLSNVAVRQLELAFTLYGSIPFKSMPNQVLSKAMARMEFSPPATPHDLRRSMATWMGENGVPPYVIEKCLAHKLGGVMEVYNRATYIPERKQAWRQWTRYLLKLRPKKKPQDHRPLGLESAHKEEKAREGDGPV